MRKMMLAFIVTFLAVVTISADGSPCVEITADDLLSTLNPEAPNFYMSGVTAGTPTPIDDFLIGQFFSSAQGTFDLGKGNNTNYATCDQCILVHEDVDASSNPKTVFFQESGSITVSEGKPTDGSGAGSIINATLAEVVIDPISFESTPVPNGRCLYLKVVVFKPREDETSDEDSEVSDGDMVVTDETVDEDNVLSDDEVVDESESVDADSDTQPVDEAESSDADTTETPNKKTISDGCSITLL